MHHGKNAARQRGYGQQLNHAHQWETNRQCDQQLDIAAANHSSLVDDQQQQEQMLSGQQASNPELEDLLDAISDKYTQLIIDRARGMEKLGLVWDVVRISPERQKRKSVSPA